MARADDEARQFLTIFSQEASQYHINILWEHLNYEESNYCITWKDGLKLVHSLNLPNVALVCDLYPVSYTHLSNLFPVNDKAWLSLVKAWGF